MALFSRSHVLDFEGRMLGTFAGTTFVAAWRDDDRYLLAKWIAPDAQPALVTPLDQETVALAASADGGRVAIAGVAPETRGRVTSDDPVELLVATLDPPGGIRLVQPAMRLTFGPDIVAPRLLWSPDSRRLALGGLYGNDADHVFTMAFDLGALPPHTAVVFGRPMQWQAQNLCVALGDARSAWNAELDKEVAWSGSMRFASPDGTFTVRAGADGAFTVQDASGASRALPDEASGAADRAWVGPHHLATDGRALDLATLRVEDVLVGGGRATVVALSADGTNGVFERDGAFVWAYRPG